MPERSKTSIDAEIRSAGIELVDITNLIAIASNKWIGTTVVDGVARNFQIEVVAKAEDFDIDAVLAERKVIDERKAETKAKADAKRIRDEKKRADAKAKLEESKAENSK